MNGEFLVAPDPPDPLERAAIVDRARSRWMDMGRVQRLAFVRSVGLKAAVLDFGLSQYEVALVLPGRFETNLEQVRDLVRGTAPRVGILRPRPRSDGEPSQVLPTPIDP